MEESTAQIYDVSMENFQESVVDASFQRVIVVDFWAEWCAPCRMLGPILEKVVASMGDRIALAKVNVDENQQIAMQFRVQSIPTVKIIHEGRIVQEFTGALPENEIRSIIAEAAGETGEDPLASADRLIRDEQYEEAEKIYRALLEQAPDDSKAIIGLGRLAILKGDTEEAHSLLSSIDEMDEQYETAQTLLSTLQFSEVCVREGGMDAVNDRLKRNPDDLDTHYALGCCYAVSNEYEKALGEFLAIIKRDRSYNDGAARKAMVNMFSTLGQESDLTVRYRELLARELF